MVAIQTLLKETIAQGLQELYGESLPLQQLQISPTRKEFTGHFTLVCFPITRISKLKPAETAEVLGKYLLEVLPEVEDFNVIQGFLNLSISQKYWFSFLDHVAAHPNFGSHPQNGEKVMVEFSSPNTNKPLHLGHIRNILLGWSSSKLLKNAGFDVLRAQVINDRGIAICKSMLAWQLFGNGTTPETENQKGDHFVGYYYVLFEQKFKAEFLAWQATPAAITLASAAAEKHPEPTDFFAQYKNTYFNTFSVLGQDARNMLLAWENNDAATLQLWQQMNAWVYAGFNATYAALGVSFDHVYYESDTYLLGKEVIQEGLANGVFYQKPDTSVWIDLTENKLDHKLVLRADGTSVYITQDLGMARKRFLQFGMNRSVYVVADEQDYHFQVLFAIMRRLGDASASGLFHLSYGMVELTTGRMKSREGTIVDADELVAEVEALALESAEARGELTATSPEERQETAHRVGMGALKYFILKVSPRKKMVFNPADSLDLQGHTGPYIQYAYVRTLNVMRKSGEQAPTRGSYTALQPQEQACMSMLHQYPEVTLEAAQTYDPSLLANFLYEFAKLYNQFYHDLRILQAETPEARQFRLFLSHLCGKTLAQGMELLGIAMPERM